MSRLIAVAIVLFTAEIAVAGQAPATGNEASVIITQGVGVLRLKADFARVMITVEARAGKAVDARSRAATEMTAVQMAIRAVGVPADALKTSSFSLQPQMEEEYGTGAKMRVREYAVRNEIEVRVDNLDLLGEVLDATGAAKTSNTLSVSIASLRFDVKDPTAAERDTLRMAVEDAMARAEAMAAGARHSLGGILRIEEQTPTGSQALLKSVRITTRSGTGAPGQLPPVRVDTPIEPNQIEFQSFVNLTVAIR